MLMLCQDIGQKKLIVKKRSGKRSIDDLPKEVTEKDELTQSDWQGGSGGGVDLEVGWHTFGQEHISSFFEYS